MKQNMVQAGRRVGAASGIGAAFVMVGLMLAGPASAQADGVTTGFTDAGTKVATYGGLAVGLIVTGLVIWLGVKYVTKAIAKA